MQRLILATSVIITALVMMLPDTANAARHDRDGYHGDRQHHKKQRHYRSHQKSRQHYRYSRHSRNTRSYQRHNNPAYSGYYPSRIRYRDWPLNFHINLGSRHYREPEVIVVEREVASARADESQPISRELFIYPREGQSESKRDQDRYECHLWSRDQTSYDPSNPNVDHGLAPDYHRAISACLEGRGYTVK